MILSGKLLPNERLPSENELKQRYSVSRFTVQHALRLLVSEGLVTRRQGLGTFVRHPVDGLMPRDEQIILHLGGINEPETPLTQGHFLFARRLEELTRGQIKIQVHHSSELGAGTEQIKKVQNNQLDMFGAAVDWLAQLEPDWGVTNMGFLFRDIKHLKVFVKSSINETLKRRLLERRALRIVSDNWFRPSRVLISYKPCFELKDLQGARMRIPAIPMYRKVWESLGTCPVEIPWGAVRDSLYRGIVDAADTPRDAILGMGFHRVAPFITLTRHLYSRACIVMAEVRFRSFRSDIRDAILRAGEEAGELYSSRVREIFLDDKNKLIQEGARFIETDIEPFRCRIRSLAERMEREGAWSKGLYRTIQEL
ncbi:MAG: TRAP transporter substrate-binding protein DctP [Deltaproteobacteria bacterium]|nr:TRAP transporter substrate-binding protein DctP [Deltaproteobacteria bacterium]MBW2308715.1 TRAP transporter substrate-binding protein DctP [Deltaproteobacteria bacterium]